MGGGARTIIVAGVANPGSGTIWGAPLATLLVELCATITVGCVLAATWLLPSYTGALGRTSRSLMVIASATGFVWFLATIVSGIFTLSDILGSKVSDVFDFNIIRSFVTQVELGQITLVALIATGIVALGSLLVTKRGSAAYVLVIAVCTAAIPAFTGHSSTLGHHNFATASMWFHIVGVVMWVGGLAVVTALAWIKQRDWVSAVGRFSTLALVCFIVVSLSGVLNAATRMTSLSQLVTSWYGRIILDKVLVLGILGWFGYHWRKRGIARLKTDKPTTFTQLALLEVALMGVALGLATALARTAPPVAGGAHGSELPTRLPSLSSVFTFQPDWLFFAGVVIAAVLYGYGLVQLSQQGNKWPIGRTFSWYLGLLIIFFITSSGFATYGLYLFSFHMGQHMFLAMVAPLFLVLGSPITMALEVLPKDGNSQGTDLRTLVLDVLDSNVTRFLLNPFFVLIFFSLSTYPIYFSSLFSWAMGNHLGHTLMLSHFMIAGLLFYIVVVGIDPIPNRPTAPVRVALLVLTMPVHAAFGVIVLSAKHILGASYYNTVGLPWLVDLKHDQAVGGGLAWVFGEIPFVLVLGVIFIQWIRSDEKEAKEVDEASGSGDADDQLAAYNDYLASLNKRGPTN
jgi:putative copper resistance protein D